MSGYINIHLRHFQRYITLENTLIGSLLRGRPDALKDLLTLYLLDERYETLKQYF